MEVNGRSDCGSSRLLAVSIPSMGIVCAPDFGEHTYFSRSQAWGSLVLPTRVSTLSLSSALPTWGSTPTSRDPKHADRLCSRLGEHTYLCRPCYRLGEAHLPLAIPSMGIACAPNSGEHTCALPNSYWGEWNNVRCNRSHLHCAQSASRSGGMSLLRSPPVDPPVVLPLWALVSCPRHHVAHDAR